MEVCDFDIFFFFQVLLGLRTALKW